MTPPKHPALCLSSARMKQKTHLMARQPSAESDNQMPHHYQPLALKKFRQSEDDHIEKDGPYMSTFNLDDSYKQDTESSSASKTRLCNDQEIAFQELVSPSLNVTKESVEHEGLPEGSGREKLKRHRIEVAGRVWIPDIWGQEDLLKDWIHYSAFDAPFVPSRIMTARAALVEEARRANAGGFGIENGC